MKNLVKKTPRRPLIGHFSSSFSEAEPIFSFFIPNPLKKEKFHGIILSIPIVSNSPKGGLVP